MTFKWVDAYKYSRLKRDIVLLGAESPSMPLGEIFSFLRKSTINIDKISSIDYLPGGEYIAKTDDKLEIKTMPSLFKVNMVSGGSFYAIENISEDV